MESYFNKLDIIGQFLKLRIQSRCRGEDFAVTNMLNSKINLNNQIPQIKISDFISSFAYPINTFTNPAFRNLKSQLYVRVYTPLKPLPSLLQDKTLTVLSPNSISRRTPQHWQVLSRMNNPNNIRNVSWMATQREIFFEGNYHSLEYIAVAMELREISISSLSLIYCETDLVDALPH